MGEYMVPDRSVSSGASVLRRIRPSIHGPKLATLALVALGAAALPSSAHAHHSMSITAATVCRTFASITATSTAASSLAVPMTARIFPDGCFGTGIGTCQ